MKKKETADEQPSMGATPDSRSAKGDRQSREKASRFAVLGMMSLGRTSGYAIKKAIAVSTAHFWSESYGNIYPVLKALMADGAIVSESDSSPSEGRQKKTYRMTARGKKMLGEWLAQPVPYRDRDNELLLKLFFGAAATPKEMLEIVRKRRASQMEQLAHYAQVAKYIGTRDGTEEEKTYWIATLRYGELSGRAEVAWCDETERKLMKLVSDSN